MPIESCPSIVSHIGSAITIKIPAVNSKLLGNCRSPNAGSSLRADFGMFSSLSIELERRTIKQHELYHRAWHLKASFER